MSRRIIHTTISAWFGLGMCLLLLWPSSGQSQPAHRSDAYVNQFGMTFVHIPAGSFLMGSADGEREAYAHEKPQHPVTISADFYLGQFEVTQAQWEEVMGSSSFSASRSNRFYDLPGMAQRLRHPQNPATVSWLDAQEFIRRLNALEGDDVYRLPTEAEWEYAARAGTQTAYSFGEDVADLPRYAWYGEDFASGSTHEVGQKQPNPWGLYDIHGNVWEWVSDWYNPQYYSASSQADPHGPATGTEKVVRGGSWHQSATSWRSAFRRAYAPEYRGISIGLRLVREIRE